MHALIIGGGIAGTATALALHRAGISSEVHEARDRDSDGVGAFLTLAVNGISTLGTLGFDVDRLPGVDTPTMELTLGDGRPRARFPLGPVLADGTTTRTVRRAELYGALRRRAAELGIPVQYGHRLASAHRAGAGVTAVFEGGATASADLLIGADGLHSATRRLIDPAAPAARYLGVLNTGGYARDLDLPDAQVGVMRMMFGRRTFFSYLPAPDGTVWWFANPPQTDEPAPGTLTRDIETWRRTVLDLVADDDPVAARIVAASDELFAPWPTHDHPDVPVWHRDRVIVIGDAAHAASPSSGQGASMAIEDAAVLALALRDSASVEAAFETYEALRRRRVARVVARGRRNGSGKAPGPVGRVIRDTGMRLVFARSARRLRRGDRGGDPGETPTRTPGWPFDYPLDWAAPFGGLHLR